MLAGRSEEQLSETCDMIIRRAGTAQVMCTDITDERQVDSLAAAAVQAYGGVDTLVCNSGVGGPSAPLWELSRPDWESTFDVNVTGTFLCCRAFAPLMVRRGSGSIVLIGSMTGKRPLVGRTPYAASKSALIGLVRSLAHELGPHGARANLISPGAVAGDRMEWVVERQAESQEISVPQARAQFTGGSAVGRFVEPGEVAAAAVFLSSDAAASVTGEDLNVSGGLTMY